MQPKDFVPPGSDGSEQEFSQYPVEKNRKARLPHWVLQSEPRLDKQSVFKRSLLSILGKNKSYSS